MKNLKPDEIEFIKEREVDVGAILTQIKNISIFKMGDYLIGFRRRHDDTIVPLLNSYNVTRKFQVIFVDTHGIPYIKELNKKGKPSGILIPLLCLPYHSEYGSERSDCHFYEIDPDYTDALIMADEDCFDATEAHRVKSDIFKEIAAHNKSCKVDTYTYKNIGHFFNTNVKIGDTLYKSIRSQFTILEIEPIPTTNGRYNIYVNFCKVQDHKGVIHCYSVNDFYRRTLYTLRPRSFNELKI